MIIHSLTRPRCGDIGEDPREIEFEPLTQPATEPVTVPATPAPVQEPAKEPVPA